MNYSVRNIVIAGGLAVVAIIAVLLYTSNVRDKARQDQHRVQVLVAAKDIPAGTTGKQVIDGHLLVPKAIIQTDQVPGALTSTAAGLDNLVVSQTIYHGQQVPSAVFQLPLATGTSLQIRGTQRAISIPIDADSGIVGTLEDGDHVDVLLAYQGSNGGASFTRPLLRDVPVLTAPSDKSGDHVLLKLSDVDATKLLYAEQYAKVWLVERPKTQAQDSPAVLETASTVLFDGLSPAQIAKAVDGLKTFTKSLNSASALGGGA
jgi:Flp pilus assembly protein CpaB